MEVLIAQMTDLGADRSASLFRWKINNTGIKMLNATGDCKNFTLSEQYLCLALALIAACFQD